MTEWQPIETAPKTRSPMYLAIGFWDDYTTDPWCVWSNDDGTFGRWPHPKPPTHWSPIPEYK